MIKKSLVWFYSVATYLLWLGVIIVALTVMGLRYYVLPHIQDYKDAIATEASRAAGQKITIGGIEASWDGLHPHLDLRNVEIFDTQNRLALSLDHIETSLSWLTLALGEPRLSSIVVHQPRLTVRREADGTIFVAGISMSGPSRPELPNWLLRQSSISILDAEMLWQDDLRKAPPLRLQKLSLQIYNHPWESFMGRHRFGLRAVPSVGASRPIDIRGNIAGRDVSKPEQWRGTVYARLEGTELAAWKTWIPFQLDLHRGFGATQLWLDFSKGQADKLVADVVVANIAIQLAQRAPQTVLNNLTTRITWNRLQNGQELRAESIQLKAGNLDLRNGNMLVRNHKNAGLEISEGSVRLDDIDIEQVAAFANQLPISQDTQLTISAIAPKGRMQRFELDWGGAPAELKTFKLRTRFGDLSINPYRGIPGFSNLGGSIEANQDGGTLSIAANNTKLELRGILREPIPADKLSGQASWRRQDSKLAVKISNLTISSPHTAGTVNAAYRYDGQGSGYIDLTGKFSKADGRHAHFYFPMLLSKDTLHWLDTSIVGGQGEDIQVILKGNLDEFPWDDNKRGLFQISGKITGGLLDYADGWPKLERLRLDLLFRGNRMELNATDGYLYGNRITKAKAVIPVLDADHPVLEINGELQSPAAEAIRFVNNSPVLDAIDRFTEGMAASGSGKLTLGLQIPLDTEGVGSKIKGSYFVSNGTLAGDGDFPALEQINGRLDFTENTLRAQKVNARIFGGPAQFSLENGRDGQLRVLAQGRIGEEAIRQAIATPLAEKLHGATDWNAEINLRKRQAEMVIKSSLIGLSSSLPPPFDKNVVDSVPLRIEKKMQGEQQDIVSLTLGKVADAKIVRSLQGGRMVVDRGEISFGGTASLPEQRGIGISGNFSHFDVDQWQTLTAGSSGSGVGINRANLAFGTLDVFGRRVNALKLSATAIPEGWRASLQSREINGDASWIRTGNGKILARLTSFLAPSAAPAKLSAPVAPQQKEQEYPALDIVADNFEVGQKKLGRLELLATQQGRDWSISKLVISNPDSTLSATGDWQNWKLQPSTSLNLSWNINDIGKTLDRFGYPDTIKGGDADLTGQLRWNGSPHEFSVAGLGGNLQFDARNGQFLKIKPGVARLFGVLSLQNLPRRLSFDFRDVFSAGFAFDNIGGKVRIDNGIMRSNDFRMEGPAAKVAISGETDLNRETQNLHIKVTPMISDSLAIAALAGGPAVGAAAWVAQKILQDPLNKLAAYEYAITGTWDDPQEVQSKSGALSAPAAPSPLGK
jgi:uncharacterized protein (TIGR02099 family)